jgi:hypothetical protein
MSPEQRINVLMAAYRETGREAFHLQARKLKREQAREYRESQKTINLHYGKEAA